MRGSTKTRNPETETESNINDRKLKNFTLHNLVQSKENFVLVFLAEPLNIFLLLCLDKVCCSEQEGILHAHA